VLLSQLSQLHNHIIADVLNLQSDENVSYVGQKQAGAYLAENVFEAGSLYHWNDMIKRATGEQLTPKYFVRQFVK
jgi:Zn-dependent M32 family carboxypeptidase